MPNYGYDPALGHEGNIRELCKQNQYRKNEISNEAQKQYADNETVEQEHTDRYLDIVEAQQKITELELRIIALEGK